MKQNIKYKQNMYYSIIGFEYISAYNNVFNNHEQIHDKGCGSKLLGTSGYAARSARPNLLSQTSHTRQTSSEIASLKGVTT